jgi:hypothetical protein
VSPDSPHALSLSLSHTHTHTYTHTPPPPPACSSRYNLLRANHDEGATRDLSKEVFKIIPYEKSQAVQAVYKLLYLESQLGLA